MIIRVDSVHMLSNIWRMSIGKLSKEEDQGIHALDEDVAITYLIVLASFGTVRYQMAPFHRFIAMDNTGTVSIFDLRHGKTRRLEEFGHGSL